MLAERILAFFCKSPQEVAYIDSTDAAALARREIPQDPLGELRREFPQLAQLVRNRTVLDFGCGFGDQAGALAAELGARVTGLDKHRGLLAAAAQRYGHLARFTDHLDGERFDVVISQDAMEHFDDPAAALAAMARALRPGGIILMTFGPPWWAPYGAHMRYFCPIPWLQLWFSEKTVMAVRARYRHDGATRYEEVESGLNKLSLARFERILRDSGLKVIERRYVGVRKMQFLTRVPVVRELATVVVSTVLAG
jgi:ubiquinone/menaquinone biosynthesis C-methylase UbiE